MNRFDPTKFAPLLLIPVLICFLFDLTRVDPPPSAAETIPQSPAIAFDTVSGSGDIWTGNNTTMQHYVPLAFAVMLPFGLGVLFARRSPGTAILLLGASTLISFFLLDIHEGKWIPAVFPAVIIASVYAVSACVDQWARSGQSASVEAAVAKEGKT
jgi:hypothetical protein